MPGDHARKCGRFKLFGVQIDVSGGEKDGESSIRRSKSLGNLETCSTENPAAGDLSGYQSDGLVHQSSKSLERRKGRAWSEEEHRSFLVGLKKLGKGDWKGIATNYVPTRNSSQVASHAQKYFIRLQSAAEKRRRRQSVFDIPLTGMQDQISKVSIGSQQDKPSESSQAATTSWAASANNVSELKVSASTIPSVMASERPPLSPLKICGDSDVRTKLYACKLQQRVSGLSRTSSAPAVQPTVAWIPFVTFSDRKSVFLPNIRGAFETGVVTPAANDEVNRNIGKLTL